jgi:hypothetical protein
MVRISPMMPLRTLDRQAKVAPAGYILTMTAVIVTIIAAFALIGALIALMALPPRVQVTVSEQALLVEPEGLDVFWTLRRRISIPLPLVETVHVGSRGEAPRPRLRLPGAHFPGLIVAGSFGTRPNRTFWDVRRSDEVLVITCKPGFEYKMVILELRDPHEVVQRAHTVLPTEAG